MFFISIKDLFKKKHNISQVISHFGFSLLILSILFNSLFSNEFSANMKVGQELSFKKEQIKFSKIEIFEKENYKSVIADFEIIDEKENVISLYPEIRFYNQPNILTSEADIISNIFSDKFMVINLLKGEEIFIVRYQTKPFMIWIWVSAFLISFGGILSLFRKN